MVYSNIFYIPKIKKVSGITTWLLEIAKKYKDLDITLVYDEADVERLNEIEKYIRTEKKTDAIIECKKLYITYYAKDLSQFKANKITGIVHIDFEINKLRPYENVDEVIAVSNKVANSYERISGIKPIVCYNPLTLEEHKKILNLLYIGKISNAKGKKNINLLLNEFERNDIPYLLTIIGDITEDIEESNHNIVYIKPNTNVRDYIPMYDYLVQLTENDDEAYSYSINEALSMGVPIIATDMTILKELGIKNKEHGYILNFDMTEIPIKEIYEEIPKPKYIPPKDIWNELLDNTPSTYKPEELIPLICLKGYTDIRYGKHIDVNDIIYVRKNRAEELIKKGLVEYKESEPDPNCKYSVSVIIPVWNQQYLITRTLDSIPTRNNVEIIVVDDKSTDSTYKVLMDYKKKHKDKNIRLLHNMENKGVGFTYNRGLDEATGDYIVRIDSDDYFYPNQFNKIIDKELDGTDMIYYNLEDNTGRILEVHKENRKGRCGAVKFIRRAFIGNTRCPEIRTAEDKYFNDELLDKYPTEKFTNRVVYHYNYPRENSLTDLTKRGLL